MQRAWVRVKRSYGTSPLTIRLERADGTALRVASVPAERLGSSDPGCGTRTGATWVSATFPTPVTLVEGQTYNLRLGTAADTRYTTDPIREGTDSGLRSYRFTDGRGQRTTNGGSTWVDLYRWSPVDLQFYLR